MSTVYTFNNKVLKNAANDKWLTKKEGPTFDEVTIGTQTWLAKNLAIDDGGEGIIIVNDVTANGVNFGTQYYYTRAAAIRVANSIPGWHLPTSAEWNTLKNYVGAAPGTKLKSTYGWANIDIGVSGNGTDDYGFTVLPLGIVSEGIAYPGEEAYFHTADMNNDKYICAGFSAYETDLFVFDYELDDPMSVRLVKDT